MYDLFSSFELAKHIETFEDFLDVIIDDLGTVSYAVPTHYDWLIKEYKKKFNVCDEISIIRKYKKIEKRTFHSYFGHIRILEHESDRELRSISCEGFMKRNHDIALSKLLGYDMLWWLCHKCKCVCVWNNDTIGIPNDVQRRVLKTFKEHNIFRGEL